MEVDTETGEALPRILTDDDLIIPHDLLDMIVERGLIGQELKNFAGPPEEKEDLIFQLQDFDDLINNYKEKLNATKELHTDTTTTKQNTGKSPNSENLSDDKENCSNSVVHDDFTRDGVLSRSEQMEFDFDVPPRSAHDDDSAHSRDPLASDPPSTLDAANAKRQKARKEREDKVLMAMLNGLRNLEEDSSANISDLFGASYPTFLDLVSHYFGENHRRFVEDPTLSVKQFQDWLENTKRSIQGRKFLADFNKLKEEGGIYEQRPAGG